jgi:hypothetical protein
MDKKHSYNAVLNNNFCYHLIIPALWDFGFYFITLASSHYCYMFSSMYGRVIHVMCYILCWLKKIKLLPPSVKPASDPLYQKVLSDVKTLFPCCVAPVHCFSCLLSLTGWDEIFISDSVKFLVYYNILTSCFSYLWITESASNEAMSINL